MSPETVKSILNNIISELHQDPSLFVARPGIDFTRDRKLPLNTMLKIIIGMNGGSIKRELYDYDKSISVTSAAFVQQRNKILPDMFGYIFRQFTDQLPLDKTYRGYNLLAVDGSAVSLATNERTDTYMENGSKEGYNAFHLSALYDLCNKIYIDAVIDPQPTYNEIRSAIQMTLRQQFNKSILIGDRGYISLNLIEHINRKPNLEYLIRVYSKWVSEVQELPMTDLDTDVSFEIRTTQTNADKELYKTGQTKFLIGKSKFGKPKKNVNWDFESPHIMKLRIVRFKINDTGDDTTDYETIVTSLDRDQFPPEEIKKLYHMRWGIETSFRELKYSIGLSHLHTRKDTAAMQEIYARLIMYNFSQCITMHVVINQKAVRKKRRKWAYQANFTYAMHLCKDYFRNHDPDPPDITTRIASEILPVRPDRQDKRKIIVSKGFVWFLYRVA